MDKIQNNNFFAKGADIGWLQQMEASGYTFYGTSGTPRDCLEILKEYGINSIRLRVWVNPDDNPRSGHNSIEEVAVMAKRVQDMGFKLMIDFHYSDSWADPGKQNKPKAWNGHSIQELAKDVYQHTYDCLTLLKQKNVEVNWVQIGNEISYGMIWPEGHIDHFEQLALFLNNGYRAVKDVCKNTKVIIHLDSGHDSKRYINFFEQYTHFNGQYDIIGMSYYPYWAHCDYKDNINALETNIKDMIRRYGKDVIITEIGGMDTEPDNTYDMIKEVIRILKSIPDNRANGIFYWEPQGAASWSGYRLSAWGDDGKPTKALKAFME